MVVTGRKPKPDGAKINHHAPTHDWREVPDVPYRGRKPRLPDGTPDATRTWWRVVTALPHCAIWSPGDWQFALDTARVHAAFVEGDTGRAAELRIRERAMGTTSDALRDLRIRYVDPAPAVEDEGVHEVAVADFQEARRRRLTDAS